MRPSLILCVGLLATLALSAPALAREPVPGSAIVNAVTTPNRTAVREAVQGCVIAGVVTRPNRTAAREAVQGCSIVGVVTRPDGTPVAGARVRVASRAGETTTDAGGNFFLSLDAGPAELIVERDADGGVERVRAAIAPEDGQTLRLHLVLPASPARERELTRPDGTRTVWYLDAPPRPSFPIVVILQGSECLRVVDKYAAPIERLVSRGIGVVRVEKPGLRADTPIGDCPPEYLRLNTLDRRILDLLNVIAALRGDRRWDGRLALIGGSEGGMVAAGAAPLIPETRAIVLISSGGGQPFQEELLDSVAAEMRVSGAPRAAIDRRLAEMRATIREILANPTPAREWLSDGKLARNTWLWWAGALPFTPLHPLLRLSCPILVVHGESDTATPMRSADMLRQAFLENKKTNLTLRRYPGGHAPSAQTLAEILDWVTATLNAPVH